MSKGAAGYKSGTTNYLLSFAGYFPPTLPVTVASCMHKAGTPASGGGMSGLVFHNIAEGIMGWDIKLDVRDAHDSTSILVPDVKEGNILAADYVLTHLGIRTNSDWGGSYANGNPIWGKAQKKGNKTISLLPEKHTEGVSYQM